MRMGQILFLRLSFLLILLLSFSNLTNADGAMVLKQIQFMRDTINLNPEDDGVVVDWMTTNTLNEINVTILLPVNTSYVASMKKTGPAIILGFEKVKELQLLPGYKVNLHYADSVCSNVNAPMEAMRLYMSKSVNVFFGPSCELALAPVARFMSFWETPLLTAGGLASDFSDKKNTSDSEYFLTTRTGIGFDEMDEFLIKIFSNHKWEKVMLMYEKDGMEEVSGVQTCRLFMSSLVNHLNKNRIRFDTFNLDSNKNVTTTPDVLESHLGLKYADRLWIEDIQYQLDDFNKLIQIRRGNKASQNKSALSNPTQSTLGKRPFHDEEDDDEDNHSTLQSKRPNIMTPLNSGPDQT